MLFDRQQMPLRFVTEKRLLSDRLVFFHDCGMLLLKLGRRLFAQLFVLTASRSGPLPVALGGRRAFRGSPADKLLQADDQLALPLGRNGLVVHAVGCLQVVSLQSS